MTCDLCGRDNCICESTLSYDREMREKKYVAQLEDRIDMLEDFIKKWWNESSYGESSAWRKFCKEAKELLGGKK